MLRISTPIRLRRTAAFALALALGGMALPAQAISVNDMVVWSASNKPLRMDIALADLQGVNLRNVSLSVASAAEHARVGLTRPEWADSISFKIIPVNSGMAVARAISSQAIEGDFVTFLVSIRGGGVAQLQQVASKVSASGAEPLISVQAESVPARAEQVAEPAPTVFADKPVAKVQSKPTPKPTPKPVAVEVREAPAPVAKAAVAPAPTPAPVAAPAATTPAPAELVTAAEADNSEVLADVGAEPTLDSLQAERIQLLQQVTDIQTRLTALDQQIAALSPESVPASETPTALAEAATSPDEPLEPKALGYTYFSNIMLGLLAVFMAGMALLDRVRASKR